MSGNHYHLKKGLLPPFLPDFCNTLNYGIFHNPRTGYGNVLDNTLIQNNDIVANDIGIHLWGSSWWLGHIDVYPVIRNNTIRDNQQQGLSIEAWGSSDSSGSDTDFQPIIQNNLLSNNGANMRLLLRPYGSDGLQILKPVIRYNTIQNAATGILLEHTEAYDTFAPTITLNVFSGLSGYAINNTTNRSMIAQYNYWGSQ